MQSCCWEVVTVPGSSHQFQVSKAPATACVGNLVQRLPVRQCIYTCVYVRMYLLLCSIFVYVYMYGIVCGGIQCNATQGHVKLCYAMLCYFMRVHTRICTSIYVYVCAYHIHIYFLCKEILRISSSVNAQVGETLDDVAHIAQDSDVPGKLEISIRVRMQLALRWLFVVSTGSRNGRKVKWL